MPEKPNQRILLTKTMLKNSLLELLQTETIQKVSIKQICQNAQINRSTFYKYYQFFRERFYAGLDERNTDFDAWRADTDLKLLERELKGKIRDTLRP